MNGLADCLAALISTIESESDALARQDHIAAATFLGSKTALSDELRRHVTAGTMARDATTSALAADLLKAIATNRRLLERSIRIRRQMLDLLRQTIRRSTTVVRYSKTGQNCLDARHSALSLVTRV